MPPAPERTPLPTDARALPATEAEPLAALAPLLAASQLPALSAAESAVVGTHLRLLDAWNPSINLTRIESRPSREELGIYVFFIDMTGHRSDGRVAEALAAVRADAAATTVDTRYGVVHAGWVVSAVGDSKLSSV